MKNLIYLFALLITAAGLLSACNRDSEPQEQGRAVSLPFAAAPDGFVFVHNGVEVVLGAPVDENVNDPAFGEPLSIRHEPSCAFDGFDLTFIYSDFIIETFPFNDIYYINMINFRNDNVATQEGLRIGMTYDDMVRLYGSDYISDRGVHTMHIFHNNGMRLAILIEQDGNIIQITYHLNLEN